MVRYEDCIMNKLIGDTPKEKHAFLCQILKNYVNFSIDLLEGLKFRSYEHHDNRPDYVLVTQIEDMQNDLEKLLESEG
jgi:hypothetical protein